jgi:hypothetical protein
LTWQLAKSRNRGPRQWCGGGAAVVRLRACQDVEDLEVEHLELLRCRTRTTTSRIERHDAFKVTTDKPARHTWATLVLRAGVLPKVVQERLGHSSIGITLDLYSHVMPGMQREAAEAVLQLIFGQRDIGS